jgi:hypothetical protein
MNPRFTEVSTMTITSPIHAFFRALTPQSRASHPEALQERRLNIPRRIDNPATTARLARELLHSRREDITLAHYMDDRRRFIGHAIVATLRSSCPTLSKASHCRGSGQPRNRMRNHPLSPLRAS